MTMGRLSLLLEQELVSKVIKTGYFAQSAGQCWAKPPFPAAPSYTTAFSCENWHFAF